MNILTKLFKFYFYALGILTGFACFIGPFALYSEDGFSGELVMFALILWPFGYWITKFCYRGWVNTYRGHKKDWAEQGSDLYTRGIALEKLVAQKFKLRNLNKENDDVTKEAKLYLSMLNEVSEDLKVDPKSLLKENNTEQLNQKYKILLDKREKLKEEAKAAALKKKQQQKKAKAKRDAYVERLRGLCNDDIEWDSFKRGRICLGMHIRVVEDIKGRGYDLKEKVSSEKKIYKLKYGQSVNQRGNYSYKLEVTYENDRVVAFKDL